jgi:hypothetical protein
VIKIRRDQVRFLNPTFPVPKPNGKWRKVVDCRRLNAEQREIHFKMDGPLVVLESAVEEDWATSHDFTNAFNHMLVNAECVPYLAFSHRGSYYAYAAMPLGPRHSPRVFTRALRYALAYIRAHWEVRAIAFADDVLYMHQDRDYLELSTLKIGYYLQSLGWTLSLEKCEFTPKQEIKFLGWGRSFPSLSMRMTGEMRKNLLSSVRRWIVRAERGERVSWRKLAALISSLNFLRAQISRASLYLRALHTALAAGVRSSGWNGGVSIPRRVISELLFWCRNIHYNTPYEFAVRLPQALLTTDVFENGWGAVLRVGEALLTAYGSFSQEYTSASSNLRETTALLLALPYFKQTLQEKQVRGLAVRTDNMVTVFNQER